MDESPTLGKFGENFEGRGKEEKEGGGKREGKEILKERQGNGKVERKRRKNCKGEEENLKWKGGKLKIEEIEEKETV